MASSQDRAYAHYGIDPSEYRNEYAHGDTFCPVCRAHYTATPYAHCELELARARDMDELGFPARFCHHCNKAYPSIIDQGAICPACDRKQARLASPTARAEAGNWGNGVYVSDGLGCVSKEPRWMVNWDGSPDGK